MIVGGRGTNFHNFCSPGDWLEIRRIFMSTLGHHQILATGLVEGKSVSFFALVTTIPGSLKPTLQILRPNLGVFRLTREYIGYMVHWKRDYNGSLAA